MAKKTKAAAPAPAPAGAEPVAAEVPAELTLQRGLRYGNPARRYAKGEVIHPRELGMSKEQTDWLVQSGTAVTESEGGEA